MSSSISARSPAASSSWTRPARHRRCPRGAIAARSAGSSGSAASTPSSWTWGRRIPTLLLINGNYTPPKPLTPEEMAAGADAEDRPHDPLPEGAGDVCRGRARRACATSARSSAATRPCDDPGSVLSYAFGATYWMTRNFGVEGSYLNPTQDQDHGRQRAFRFNTAHHAATSGRFWARRASRPVRCGSSATPASITTRPRRRRKRRLAARSQKIESRPRAGTRSTAAARKSGSRSRWRFSASWISRRSRGTTRPAAKP